MSLCMVEASNKRFVVMLEDSTGPAVGLKRPKQPASREQRFNRSNSQKKALFSTFEQAEDFAKSIVLSGLGYGVWQYFPEPLYISNR